MNKELEQHIEQLKDRLFLKPSPGIDATRDAISDLMLVQALLKYKTEPNLETVETTLQQEILQIPIVGMDSVMNITRLFSELAAVKTLQEMQKK